MTISIRELSKGKRDLWKLDPRIIKIKPEWNCRADTPELHEHISTIAKSICEIGYLQDKPLVVFQEEGIFYVSDGHCRLKATMAAIEAGAEIESVPVVTEPQGANDMDRVLGMLTRNSGLSLTPLEQGSVYKRLAAFGLDGYEIARRTGRSARYVDNIFALMEATAETHASVVAKEVAPSVVAKAVKKLGPAKAGLAIKEAIGLAKENGQSKATAADVEAVNGLRPRQIAEVVAFFQGVASDDSSPAQAIAVDFLGWQSGVLTTAEFASMLNQVTEAGVLA